MLKLFDAASRTAAVSFSLINLTQKQYQDVQLELLQHKIKIHLDQLKNSSG